MTSQVKEEFIEMLRKEMNERNKYEQILKEEEVKSIPQPPPIAPIPPQPEPRSHDSPAITLEEDIRVPKKYRIIVVSLFVALGALVYYFFNLFYYFFVLFLEYSIQLFQQGDNGLAVVCLLVQIAAWLVAFFLFYVGFFNIVFPRIRSVNAMRTHNTIARKVIRVIGPNPDFVYLKIKFKLFPIFDWYTLKIPKGLKWVRMPNSLDMHSENIDLNWENGMYVISKKPLNRIPDEIKTYRAKAQKSLRLVGEEVGLSISGDSDMMKDYYSLNLVMDEEEPVKKSSLKKPASELEKEVDDGN